MKDYMMMIELMMVMIAMIELLMMIMILEKIIIMLMMRSTEIDRQTDNLSQYLQD